jgi:hypothetical protein
MSSIIDNINKLDEIIKNFETDLKTVKGLAKEIKKNYNADLKKNGTKKTKKTESNGDKKTYGITEPKVLPPNVYEFINYALTNKKLSEDFINNNNDIFENFTKDTLVARTKVNSIIHNYIKSNNLYVDEVNKRSEYAPDEKLKELLEMKDKEELNLKNIQTFLKRAYDKFKSDDQKKNNKKQKKEESEIEEVEVEEDETENDSD